LLLFRVNVANYIQEEYLLFGCVLAMLMYKTASDGKYVRKSLHLRFGELQEELESFGLASAPRSGPPQGKILR
jgi:hypothetical protein